MIITETDSSARNWAALSHLSALVILLGVPLGNVLGPLVVWLIRRNDHPFVDAQGKEALNFQISVTLYTMVAMLLGILGGVGLSPFFWPIHRHFWGPWDFVALPFAIIAGMVLLMGLVLIDLVLVILAAYRASNGEEYRYPLSMRLIG